MGVLEGGVSAALVGVGLEAASPLHVVVKPLSYGAGGHYRIARRLVPASTTLAGTLWVARNPTASGLLVVVKRVLLRAVQVAAPTAAIEDRFSLFVSRGWTVAGTTGSASIAPAAAMQEMRSSMASSILQLREANVAAGHSGDTKTNDGNPIAGGSVWVAAALGSLLAPPVTLFDYNSNLDAGEHPLTLVPDEGFTLTNDNNFGATSGIVLFFEIAWAETSVF